MGFAVILTREIKYRNLWRGLQFLPWLLPPIVVATLWVSFYLPVQGLINTILRNLGLSRLALNWLGNPNTALLAIIIAESWTWYPFFSVTYLSGMQGIPKAIYDAASVDGASGWKNFWYITLPLLKPFVLSTSIIQFIWLFRYFDMVWIMTKGGPAKASEVVATQVYKTAFYRYRFEDAAALGIIMALIMLIFVFFYLYYYRKAESLRG